MTRLFLLLITFVFLATPALSVQSITGKVVRVLDGDTIDVLDDRNEKHRIRFAEIDCPERKQPFGRKAQQFVTDRAAQKEVVVQVTTKDRYGRLIGHVILPNGENLNRMLVENGFAWWYERYSKDKSLQALEQSARDKKLGLWRDKNPIAPWEWRKKK